MKCRPVEIEMPEGYTKEVTECNEVRDMPKNLKGVAVYDRDLILINEDLEDLKKLGISNPELYVSIHEKEHFKHPYLTGIRGEYKIRKISDKKYEMETGERIDTAIPYLLGIFNSFYENFVQNLEKTFD